MSDRLRGLHLHIDGVAGAAGDMMLGALLDLGVPREVIEEAFDRVGVGKDRLRVERVVKHGLAAVNVTIAVDEPLRHGDEHDHEHGEHGHEHGDHGHEHGDHGHEHGDHGHEHGDHGDHGRHDHTHGGHGQAEHGHHPYSAIEARIRAAGLDPASQGRALDIFARVARAEAHLHATTVEKVAFHEVGAIDSIADIVGAAAGLAYLAPAAVTATPVAMGHGQVRTAHGVLPVPSPAALEILRAAGGMTCDGGVARELCTPTGAAILAHAVNTWQPMPPLQPVAIGHGAGDADLPDRPNVLRLVVGQPRDKLPAADETIYRVEANVDDMSPEMCEHAADILFAAGAVDVWWTAITMKKSRPALLLQALVPAGALDPVLRAVVVETTSIGVRFDRVARRVLDRRQAWVDTRFGSLPIKLASLDGQVVNAAPEYEACRAAARAYGAPLKQVFAAAVAAWEQQRG
jgi:pyridinium-3,5-bisthiocarboxylic acid mononucleotide nickel chelatase